MSLAYSRARVGKILDRAGHPGTPHPERVVAVALAYDYCSARGRTFSDVAAYEDHDTEIPFGELHAEIADLTIARADDARRIAELEEQVASLTASLDRLREDRDAGVARESQLQTELSDLRRENDDIRDRIALGAIVEPQPAPVEPGENTPPPSGDADAAGGEPKEWSRSDWTRFEVLASAGHARAKIARELTAMLNRIVSVACVSRLMRIRWSPTSGQRYALWAAGEQLAT